VLQKHSRISGSKGEEVISVASKLAWLVSKHLVLLSILIVVASILGACKGAHGGGGYGFWEGPG
jgi:hypothetical protein